MGNIVYDLQHKGYPAEYCYNSEKHDHYDSDGWNYSNYKKLTVQLKST